MNKQTIRATLLASLLTVAGFGAAHAQTAASSAVQPRGNLTQVPAQNTYTHGTSDAAPAGVNVEAASTPTLAQPRGNLTQVQTHTMFSHGYSDVTRAEVKAQAHAAIRANGAARISQGEVDIYTGPAGHRDMGDYSHSSAMGDRRNAF